MSSSSRTTPQCLSLALFCKILFPLEGICRGGRVYIICFSFLTATVYSSVHAGGFFLSNLLNGLVSLDMFGTKSLK